MALKVILSRAARRDVEEIWRFIAEQDSVENAGKVLEALQDAMKGLGNLPQRGNAPKELMAFGNTEYREIHYKPYRIIYRIGVATVNVHGVFDGRRNMQILLQRRLLKSR
ncbi:type II toxin-antitoxin system RelE/ParE family toxin [Inquilinus limosus]|uniref:type II toxin-antitoxin system RelE/ParE family toxin n=1 Tax=Inquilinus limosus TaxID=171674 RepID=UPI003F16C7A5